MGESAERRERKGGEREGDNRWTENMSKQESTEKKWGRLGDDCSNDITTSPLRFPPVVISRRLYRGR